MPTGRTSGFPEAAWLLENATSFEAESNIPLGASGALPPDTARGSRHATSLIDQAEPRYDQGVSGEYRSDCHIPASTPTHKPTDRAYGPSRPIGEQDFTEEHASGLPQVSITLLGGFSLYVGGKEVGPLPRKVRALLAYLSMHNGVPVSRETISDLLWTGRGVEQARHSLRQALLVLGRALRGADDSLIRSRDGTLSLRPHVVRTDVERFRTLAGSLDPVALATAGALFKGPLLGPFGSVAADFDDWLERTRRELAADLLDVLGRLSDASMAADNPVLAAQAAERMLAIDPLREDVHRRLMRIYVAAGRRGDALRLHAKATKILHTELGVSPAAETETLVAALRGNAAPSPFYVRLEPSFHHPGGRQATVMVLPFEVIGSIAITGRSGAGLAADIVCRLTELRDLAVKPLRPEARCLAGGSAPGQTDAASRLRYVVRGFIRQHGGQIRVTSEVVDALSCVVIWARIHDSLDNLSFADQDLVVSRIVDTLISLIGKPDDLHRSASVPYPPLSPTRDPPPAPAATTKPPSPPPTRTP